VTTWDPIVPAPPAPPRAAEPPAQPPQPPPPISTGPVSTTPIQWLARADFVVVDVETTGWHPQEAAITEIAAVRVSDGQPAAEFSTLVNPGRPIPQDIVTLTGITDAMVSQAPPVGAVLPGFLAFARSCVLTAHNAPFDVGFLAAACGRSSILWPDFSVIDTAALARSVLDEAEVPDCKLATLAGFFGVSTQPNHRALADARATADVLRRLIGRLASSGVRTLAELPPDRRPPGSGGTLLGQSAPPAPRGP
jgi:DNA polymerase-3 subunit epsilon